MSLQSNMLHLVKTATSDQLREVGEYLTWAADQKRDDVFLATVTEAFGKFVDPKDLDLIAIWEASQARMRRFHDPLFRDGLQHSKLLKEELVRRGDTRSVSHYLNDEDAMEISDLETHWIYADDGARAAAIQAVSGSR